MIGGRPTEEIFSNIALEIYETCNTFCQRTRNLERFLGSLKSIAENQADFDLREEHLNRDWPTRPHPLEDPEKIYRNLRKLGSKQHKRLQRIQAMKERAAQALGIPQRRLCDHIFQFSPSLYRDRFAKFSQNIQELDSLRPKFDLLVEGRFFALACQSWHIWRAIRRRRDRQSQLIANRDLHYYVEKLASLHSTSGALKIYAQALAAVAATFERGTAVTSLVQGFLFLYRKQQAHPGYHLHALLISACENMAKRDDKALTSRQNALDLQWFLQEVESVFGERLEEATRLLFGDENHRDAEKRARQPEEIMSRLKLLPTSLTRLITKSRQEIREVLAELVAKMSGEAEGSLYLVAHGYSKTVRDSLLLGDLGRSRNGPKLFLLLGEAQSDKENFDARVMEDELKTASRGAWDEVAAGNEEVLLGLVEKGDILILLLGAECFDGEKRVVHARGFARNIEDFRGKVSDNPGLRLIVVVLAEEYKFVSQLLGATQFYDDHYDQVDLYHGSSIDLIISSGGRTLPREWKDITLV